MRKTLRRIKKRLGPSPKRYSDINRRFILIVGLIAIIFLAGVIYFINEAIQPPNITVASKEIFDKGMVRIGVRTDLGRYSRRNEETGAMEGFEIEVCEEVLRRIFQNQIVIRYEEITSTTKLSKLNRGEIDVCIGAFVPGSSSRITLNYSDGFFVDTVALVTRKDQRLNVLKANKVLIGTLNNSYADSGIAEYLETVNETKPEAERQEYEIIPYASYQDLFDAVENFNVDLAAVDTLFISQYLTDELVVLPDRMLRHEYCFAFNSRDVELEKVFSKAITAMYADGTIAELEEKWAMDDLLSEQESDEEQATDEMPTASES